MLKSLKTQVLFVGQVGFSRRLPCFACFESSREEYSAHAVILSIFGDIFFLSHTI